MISKKKRYLIAIAISVGIAILQNHVEVFTIEQLKNISFVFLAVLLSLYGISSSLSSDIILKIFKKYEDSFSRKEINSKTLNDKKENIKTGFSNMQNEIYTGVFGCFIISIYSYSYGFIKYIILSLLNENILSQTLLYLKFGSHLVTVYAFIALFITFYDIMKTLRELNILQINSIK